MSLIVDASVAVKWFSEEEQSDLAETLLASMELLIAPDLVIAEIGNALWKRPHENCSIPIKRLVP